MPLRTGWSGRYHASEARNERGIRRERAALARPLRVPPVRDVQAGEVLMTSSTLALVAVYLIVALVLVKPVGLYMANVMEGRPIWPLRLGASMERFIYRLCGEAPATEMSWKGYAIALIVFNAIGALAVYALQRLQLWLPLNPQHFANVSPDSSFNTAVSFITNTNWQGY